jgi:hypothetical protein
MYNKIEGGECLTIQGLKCWTPPLGYGIHVDTGGLAKVDIIKRSLKASEQYWEPQRLPDELDEWREEEEARIESEPDYSHPQLQKIKQREWHRRLYGCWFYNNGKPIYLTGLHYFYLNYWHLDTGLPDYRLIDLEYFYFWQYIVLDPKCIGEIEIRKRRDGKTYRATCILYEYISRTGQSHAGIQSKNKDDAEDLFQNKLVPAFIDLPFFFKPTYDRAKGDTPKGSLRFFRTSDKSKHADKKSKDKELRSSITFKDKQAKAYDGRKLKRLLLDESGKVEVNVMDRHAVVKYCVMDNKRKVIGKMIVTSTVEEIGVRYKFDKLWDNSNHNEREANGTTKTGLYRFFIPAHRSGDYDIYGTPKEEETLKAILADRKAIEDNLEDLNNIIRKEPLNPDEAFRISTKQCHFNPIRLNNRLTELGLMDNVSERGNFLWENGERDTKVIWQKDPKGKWERCWWFDDLALANNVIKRGSLFLPGNEVGFITACDPIDQDKTEDEERQSKAAAFTLRRHSPFAGENDLYNKAFVCKYHARPEAASLFYEDMIKQCVYYGSPILYENNKGGIKPYFDRRGYYNFLIHFADRKEPGIPSTEENKIIMVELVQDYVLKHCDKVYFPDLLKDWLKFDIKETQKYDLAMAAGWTIVADMYKVSKRNLNQMRNLTDFFRKYKVAK